jgi:hypothetical protein
MNIIENITSYFKDSYGRAWKKVIEDNREVWYIYAPDWEKISYITQRGNNGWYFQYTIPGGILTPLTDKELFVILL